ncbi:MAG: 50S ribosomal protein L25/general stress protein Ctc [Bacteroidaceae bacterium]|nr:50S ribosomal protein L25/general stress protein Ctc [Bacteroidaceae bacterium]MBP5647069.1 50S ribosomal protein L25/general stress protein Ctc [Bacteroidaceae bacterium]
MKSINVKGTARNEFGKKGAKALRKQNLIPCNLYGVERNDKGLPVAKAFSVTNEEVRNLVYSPDIFSVNLTIDGTTVLAVMREIQFHPVKDNILHIDFYQITEDKPIVMEVPVKLNGLAAGVKAGGKLEQIMRRVKAKALYTAIPEKIDIDVTPLTIGKSFKVCDLNVDGIEFTSPKEAVICTVMSTRSAAANAEAAEGEEAAE